LSLRAVIDDEMITLTVRLIVRLMYVAHMRLSHA